MTESGTGKARRTRDMSAPLGRCISCNKAWREGRAKCSCGNTTGAPVGMHENEARIRAARTQAAATRTGRTLSPDEQARWATIIEDARKFDIFERTRAAKPEPGTLHALTTEAVEKARAELEAERESETAYTAFESEAEELVDLAFESEAEELVDLAFTKETPMSTTTTPSAPVYVSGDSARKHDAQLQKDARLPFTVPSEIYVEPEDPGITPITPDDIAAQYASLSEMEKESLNDQALADLVTRGDSVTFSNMRKKVDAILGAQLTGKFKAHHDLARDTNLIGAIKTRGTPLFTPAESDLMNGRTTKPDGSSVTVEEITRIVATSLRVRLDAMIAEAKREHIETGKAYLDADLDLRLGAIQHSSITHGRLPTLKEVVADLPTVLPRMQAARVLLGSLDSDTRDELLRRLPGDFTIWETLPAAQQLVKERELGASIIPSSGETATEPRTADVHVRTAEGEIVMRDVTQDDVSLAVGRLIATGKVKDTTAIVPANIIDELVQMEREGMLSAQTGAAAPAVVPALASTTPWPALSPTPAEALPSSPASAAPAPELAAITAALSGKEKHSETATPVRAPIVLDNTIFDLLKKAAHLPGDIFLYGPSGVGKTMFPTKLALDMHAFLVSVQVEPGLTGDLMFGSRVQIDGNWVSVDGPIMQWARYARTGKLAWLLLDEIARCGRTTQSEVMPILNQYDDDALKVRGLESLVPEGQVGPWRIIHNKDTTETLVISAVTSKVWATANLGDRYEGETLEDPAFRSRWTGAFKEIPEYTKDQLKKILMGYLVRVGGKERVKLIDALVTAHENVCLFQRKEASLISTTNLRMLIHWGQAVEYFKTVEKTRKMQEIFTEMAQIKVIDMIVPVRQDARDPEALKGVMDAVQRAAALIPDTL